jgi:N-acetylglucosamine-6-sulfatase
MRGAIGGLLALIALTALAWGGDERSEAAPPAEAGERPNVVVVMTDDQTQASISAMPRTQELVGSKGATFTNSVVNWPLCCPARATFLTGQYAHNHQVLGNEAPLGGFDRLQTAETLPVWLQRAGYFTAHIGKFLNGYEQSATGVPPGWSEWHGSKRTYTFYGYQLLEGGQLVTYGSTGDDPDNPAEPAQYSTDVYTDKAVELIGRRAPAAEPFFLSLAYLAPHSGGPNSPEGEPPVRCQTSAKPAARHNGVFANESLPTPPGFNEADVADKPAGIQSRPVLTTEQVAEITRDYRCRMESLLAIDEGVERIVNALQASGELENTLLVFTSDNGFFHGEHRIQTGKNRVYEEAIRVPLMLRGPGVAKGITVDEPAINADLAPTILHAAGGSAGLPLDGRSLLPLAEHPERAHGRELLIEQDSYVAVRNRRYVYAEYTAGDSAGEVELYDLVADPYELVNQQANPAYAEVRAALAARLARLRGCVGESCRTKPALKLDLPRSRRSGGRSCRPPRNFVARVRGQGASGLVLTRFAVGPKRAGKDTAGPFKREIRPRLLRSRRRPWIRVVAELIDGRVVSLQRKVRICREV